MKVHELKTWPEHFMEVYAGRKTFELRLNDRGFKAGDELLLREWLPRTEQYTGNEIRARVSHILYGPAFGLEAAHVIMSLHNPVASLRNIPAATLPPAPADANRCEEPWSL